MNESVDELRLDLCLHNLRFCKTRPLARALVEKGRVRVNGEKTNKPARKVRIGDILVFPAHNEIQSIRLINLPEKRVGAALAQSCYESIEMVD